MNARSGIVFRCNVTCSQIRIALDILFVMRQVDKSTITTKSKSSRNLALHIGRFPEAILAEE
jgi:hypothetical protein